MTNWPWIALTLLCVIGILFYIRKDHLRKVQDLQLQQQGQEMERRLQETAEQILLRMEQEAVRLEALLARCEEQTQRMEGLVKQLLTLSRIEAAPTLALNETIDVPMMLRMSKAPAVCLRAAPPFGAPEAPPFGAPEASPFGAPAFGVGVLTASP